MNPVSILFKLALHHNTKSCQILLMEPQLRHAPFVQFAAMFGW
jgi:hypothetical protein